MLFVSILTPVQGSSQERAVLRAKWSPPAGITPVAEYWLNSSEVNVIYVFEAESAAAMLAIRTYWSDFYDVETFPAVTGDEGMRMIEAMSKRKASA